MKDHDVGSVPDREAAQDGCGKDWACPKQVACDDDVQVSLWSIAEAKIDDIIHRFVLADPSVLSRQEFEKIAIPASDALSMKRSQLCRDIVNQYKEKVGSSFKKGIGRFENVLSAIGLGGGVPDGAKKAFMEISELRNNLVHKMGVADKKLIDACPWLNLREGQRYRLDRDNIRSYSLCIKCDILEIDRRIMKHFGEPIPPGAQKLYDLYLRDCPISSIIPQFDSGTQPLHPRAGGA